MSKRNSNEQRVIREIQRLRSNLTRRLKRIGERSVPFRAYMEIGNKNLKNMNIAELVVYKRELRTLNEKKYTTVKGYKEYTNWQLDLGLADLTYEQDKKMYSVYEKVTEGKKVLLNYKYEVLGEITEMIIGDYSEEDILKRFDELYKEFDEQNQNGNSMTFSTVLKKNERK